MTYVFKSREDISSRGVNLFSEDPATTEKAALL